jgi:3-hydroxyacyl-[acyl-carrier-protein] dehydratase
MWIDRVVELVPGERLVAIKHVSLAEEHLHEHFAAAGAGGRPAMPLMPASLIVEGMAQSAGILVGHAGGFREKVILAKVGRVELEREAGPGDTLRYTAVVQQLTGAGASTAGTVELIGANQSPERAELIGRIDLVFSHVDQNMAGTEFPEHNFVFGEGFRTLLRTSGVSGAW